MKRKQILLWIAATAALSLSACCLVCKNQQPASTDAQNGKSVKIYTTSKDSDKRLALTDTLKFSSFPQPLETQVFVYVDPSSKFQEVLGIGGAMTDSSAETYAKLPADKQKELIQAYFDKDKGIAYSLIRTNIHSCDFSSDSYTYVNEGDMTLSTFSVAHDKAFRIPFIKKSIEAAGGSLVLYASPWSPPAYMKTNGTMLHGGNLKPECYQLWADYYVKFIQAYEKEGIPVWGISVQNEPMAVQKWESCNYTAEQERDFLKNYLGPTLNKNGMSDRKIIIWDHNRDLIAHRANIVLSDPAAAKYVWGIGFHWYETWAGGKPMFANVERVHEDYPGKNMIFTEGCNEKYDPARLNDWKLGERYGESMINDFNAGAVGWTDWNVLLDEQGGPNHVGNYCFAPVHADLRNGSLIYTNSYYYIGHFSKFVKPNAKRISSSASRSQLLTTAFVNPDGQIVTIVMNQSDEKIEYHLLSGTQGIDLSIPAHSIQTLIF